MNKILISRNRAIQLLDTNAYIFKNFISPQLEYVKIGEREKVVFQSLQDFIDRNKHKSDIITSQISPSNVIPKSICNPFQSSKTSKKVRINLEE